LGESPKASGSLGIAILTALVPDEVLDQLTMKDVFDYREDTKAAYSAWSAEIDRLATSISDMDPDAVSRQLPVVLETEIKPRLRDYRDEMKAARDRLWGDLIKKTLTWNVPAVSLASLSVLSWPGAIALFASTVGPSVVDYYVERRKMTRTNSAAYLIDLVPALDDDR
jgi:hypothetical protein